MAGRFSIAALRPVSHGWVNSVNRCEILDQPQEYSAEGPKSLNNWAAKVQHESEAKQSQAIKKTRSRNVRRGNHDVDKAEPMDEAFKNQPKPNGPDIKIPEPLKKTQHPVMVRDEKDLIKVAGKIAALPSGRKAVAKAYKKINI